MPATALDQLETPCLLLDAARMDRNIAAMHGALARHGVPLRPHVKTAKSIEPVRRMLAGQPGGITVSTLREAEVFLDHGITDICYAVGIAPNKVDHAADLIARGARLVLLLDSLDQARMLDAAGARLGTVFEALVEIDVDGHRAGVVPDDPALIDIGKALASGSHTRLAGVLTHAGGSYVCRSVAAIRAIAEQERALTVRAAENLHAAGLACPVVSVGSTPTARFAEKLDGVTEVRAGVFVFQDLVQAGLGVCRIDDIAISVLASVIGHRREPGQLIIDAGWMALSRDRGTAAQALDQGYGLVCTAAGAPCDGMIVTEVNQEHGIVARRDGTPLDPVAWPVGSLLRILPNHACATAAAHERYHVLDDGKPGDCWPRFGGW